MKAKQANEVYKALQNKVCRNSMDTINTWQKSRDVDIPQLIKELGDKRRKVNFRVSVVLPACFFAGLGILVFFVFLAAYPPSKNHPHLFIFFILASLLVLTLLVSVINEKLCIGPENDARNVSLKVYDTLSDLERDLSLFGKNSINSETLRASVSVTAISIIEAQNELLRLAQNNSVIANIMEILTIGEKLVGLREQLDDKIASASRFGIVLDRNDILSRARRIS